MRKIPTRRLAMECCGSNGTTVTGFIGQGVTVSPDTDDQAIGLEQLAAALEDLVHDPKHPGPVHDIVRQLGTEHYQVISAEDASDWAKYGAIAALVAAIIAAIGYAIQKFGKKSQATLLKTVDEIKELAQEIESAEVPKDTDEFRDFKKKLWDKNFKGIPALFRTNPTLFAPMYMEVGRWSSVTADLIGKYKADYIKEIEAAINNPEVTVTSTLYEEPKEMQEKLSGVMSWLAAKVDADIRDPLGILKYCHTAMAKIDAYSPGYDDSILMSVIKSGIAPKEAIDRTETIVKSMGDATKNLADFQKKMTELKSLSQKNNKNSSLKSKLLETLESIKIVMNYYKWVEKALDADRSMLKAYKHYLDKQKKPDAE